MTANRNSWFAPSGNMLWCLGVTLALLSSSAGQSLPTGDVPPHGSGPALSGPNVCSQVVARNEWEDVTESYDCWETVEVESSHCSDHSRPGRRDCYWGWQRPERHRSRGKRGTDCYKAEPTTCHKTVRQLVCKKELENVCCAGYKPDGHGSCVGDYSCGFGNGGCEHMCVLNWDGSTRCACNPGYALSTGGRCVDFDECEHEGSNSCNQKCINTDGGHYCACDPGFSLINPWFCAETDECAIGNGGCQHQCVNTRGAFYCLCQPGFDLVHGKECIDTDECSLHNGGCSDGCRNQYGYYECSCPETTYLSRDNKTCAEPADKLGPRIPGAEASTDGDVEEGGFPTFMVIGAVLGALALIMTVVLSLCLMRKCNKSRDGAPPPPPSPLPIFTTNDYDYVDPALAMNKKADPEICFDNPGYGEKAEPPPSYSSDAGTSSPHAYLQLQPPSYEETKSHAYEEIKEQSKKESGGPDYDNAPENAGGNVKRMMENFENKTKKLEETRGRPPKVSRTSDRGYDNVINEIQANARS